MMKRRKKVSMSWEEWHEEVGVANSLVTTFPYFVRDVLFQKIIFQEGSLSLKEKISLSRWSFANHDHMFQELGNVVGFYRRKLSGRARGVLRRSGAGQ